jgi:RNA polymerase sigma-70 factor (ECF subfamily)
MTDEDWLRRFHDGERTVIEECYRDHFKTVERSVGAILAGADKETVVHEVFFRLITKPEVRANFRGGSLAGWMATVARNYAVDHVRRYALEEAVAPEVATRLADSTVPTFEDSIDARHLVEQFRRECLSPAWDRVFVARFIEQLSQREAAARLSMRRTTLAYQELRIRRLLRRFLLRGGGS